MKSLNVFLRGNSYYVHFRHRGKRYLRSMDTREKAVAEQRARQLYKQVSEERWDVVDQLRMRREYCSLGAVLERYEAAALAREATVAANMGALKIVVREVLGLDKKFDVQSVGVDVVNADLARKFQQQRLEKAGKDHHARLRAGITINSTLRQARSVFGGRALDRYLDLKLGDVGGFKDVPALDEPDVNFKPIEETRLAEMAAAVIELQRQRPVLYLVHLHFSRLLMRNSEIEAARKEWLVKRGNYWGYDIIRREITTEKGERIVYAPKGKERFVAMSDDVYQEICLHHDKDGWIIPARHKTERHDLIYKAHSKWVKQFIPGRSKTSYELRKHGGSLVAQRDGLWHAQMMLGHKSPKTTSDSYVAQLNPVKPLEARELAPLAS